MTEVSKEEYARRRALWYAWLESGQHEQARTALRKVTGDQTSFCCLGGLCEVYTAETHEGEWRLVACDGVLHSFFGDKGYTSETALSLPIMDWIGMRGSEGHYDSHSLTEEQKCYLVDLSSRNPNNDILRSSSLTGLNDHVRLTFSEIAGFCKLNPPGLWIEGTY